MSVLNQLSPQRFPKMFGSAGDKGYAVVDDRNLHASNLSTTRSQVIPRSAILPKPARPMFLARSRLRYSQSIRSAMACGEGSTIKPLRPSTNNSVVPPQSDVLITHLRA